MSDPSSEPANSSSHAERNLHAARNFLLIKNEPIPEIGIVLGSGLGNWAEQLTDAHSVEYAQIPGMASAGVAGHGGKLWLGRSGSKRVACLQGRVHAYEGHEMERVVYGVRLLAKLGCRCVLLTNAAGGIRADLAAGSLMLITDHINLTGRNPLVGWPCQGGPFIDMSCAYDADLRSVALDTSRQLGVALTEGVYAAVLGPSYETPAEVKMLGNLGAAAVGMSTAVETIALRAEGIRVGAISCITNAAAGISQSALNHAEVQATAARVSREFQALLSGWIEAVPPQP